MKRDSRRKNPQPRTRLQPEERRRLIVEAAFEALAREGFEGLRTRDIAAAVGINSATLHHYFQTKQDLIEGITQHLETRLRNERAPASPHGADDFDPFGREFQDLIFYQQNAPDILAVYRELAARAPRDPMIRDLVDKLHAGWKASVVAALTKARARNLLGSQIDIDTAAGLVLSTAWGLLARIFRSATELEAAAEQLRSLLSPTTTKSKARARVRR